jgi:arsenite methyltransferase
MSEQSVTEAVRKYYGDIALQVLDEPNHTTCCDTNGECSTGLYDTSELTEIPAKAVLASQGCGNPTALVKLQPGQTVLDLGSGGGIDVLLSARRVGAEGFVYGLDMTDAMLELARKNAREANITNVEFLKGDIADIPLPDASVDVIISNCVINLAADKTRVLREAFRVLKPGGKFAVSDIVIEGALPEVAKNNAVLRQNLQSWAGCIGGALTDSEYRRELSAAGFTEIELVITNRYNLDAAGALKPELVKTLGQAGAEDLARRYTSSFVRATKPLVTFRRAQPDDWEQVAELLSAASLPLAGVRENLANFRGAILNEKLVGVAGLEVYGQVALLRSLAVAEAGRGTGLGQTLTRHVLKLAQERGVRQVILLTTTAENFFRRFDFQPVERADVPPEVLASTEFQGACPASATIMSLNLS